MVKSVRVRMRRRDVVQPEPETKELPEVLRLEALLADQPPPDLTELEARLRTAVREEVQELRTIVANMPQHKPKDPANYRFLVHRQEATVMIGNEPVTMPLVDHVDGVVLGKDQATLLANAARNLH